MASYLKLNGDPSEDDLQTKVAKMLDFALLPPAIWFHPPNGGYALPKHAWAKLLRWGLKKGLPDCLFFWPGHVLGIELKARAGRPSSAQRDMHARLTAAGVPVYVCRSEDEVIALLRRTSIPMRRLHMDGAVSYHAPTTDQAGAQAAATRGPQA